MTKRIYQISLKGSDELKLSQKERKALLGGKGSALWEMVNDGLNVPPAFTITTEVCNHYRQSLAKNTIVNDLMAEVVDNMHWLDEQFGFRPLVSVRSGAPVSMPGMMDTILNVGLTRGNIGEWVERIGARAAWDSYRRLIQMLGSTAYGVPMEQFNMILEAAKARAGAKLDADLTVEQLFKVCGDFEKAFQQRTGKEFPQYPMEQVQAAIVAVFDSWMNPRAIEYRKLNKLSEAMGTAVTVQAMVFGNMGDDSGTGVLFTRDPSDGTNFIMGEFLPNAQGEDVVAGTRTPMPLAAMDDMPTLHREMWQVIGTEIDEVCDRLEETYRDMVDVEFTVQKGELFILQSRVGKRSAMAAFKIASDLYMEGVVTKEEALDRLTTEQYKIVRRPTINPTFKDASDLTGLPACPGVATGRPVFSAAEAVSATDEVILVTHETTPDDISGMNAAKGILTQTGGATSHAAVVARAMDKPCVVGCTELDLTAIKAAGYQRITIDGATGQVWFQTEVPVIDGSSSEAVKTVTKWAIEQYTGSILADDVELEGASRTFALSEFWGDIEAVEAILDTIENPATITLDMTPPADRAPTEDALIDQCFSHAKPLKAVNKQFLDSVLKMLLEGAGKLGGMTLTNLPEHTKPEIWKELGYIVTRKTTSMMDIISGDALMVDKEFVDKVLGGEHVMEEIRKLMAEAGRECRMVSPAVPVEYAVFQVLGA